MKVITIQNLTRPLEHPLRAKYCNRFACQFRGLMFRRSLLPDEGLLLVQSRENRLESAIHTLFMFIDLAVVWIDSAQRVVDVKLARRWHPLYMPQSPASAVLELPAYWLHEFKIGDQLQFDDET
ncbi:MAG TPA: hypothetical protein EYP88_08605 [Anaerolineales bacterium]|nr:hypothetical protein [Anaerolineales bacterium]